MIRIDETLTQSQTLDRAALQPNTQQKMNGYYKQLRQFSEYHGIPVVNQELKINN